MTGVAVRARFLFDRLNRRPAERHENTPPSSQCPVNGAIDFPYDGSNHDRNENQKLSILPLIALASIFNLTTSDAMAFPDTAIDLTRRLFVFPWDDGN
jgi:hypothetical protein